jgi:hypothetical protein
MVLLEIFSNSFPDNHWPHKTITMGWAWIAGNACTADLSKEHHRLSRELETTKGLAESNEIRAVMDLLGTMINFDRVLFSKDTVESAVRFRAHAKSSLRFLDAVLCSQGQQTEDVQTVWSDIARDLIPWEVFVETPLKAILNPKVGVA